MKMDHLTVMYILSVEVKNTVVLAASHENSAHFYLVLKIICNENMKINKQGTLTGW